MKSQIPLYIVIAGIGIVIGLLLQKSPDPRTPAAAAMTVSSPSANEQTPDSAQTTTQATTTQETDITSRLDDVVNQVNQLQDKLKQEAATRQDLQKQVTQLKGDVKLLASAKSNSSNDPQDNTLSTGTVGNNSQGSQWFNSQALVDAGVDQSEAQHIQQVYEDVEMQKLYLRDKAIREGWIGQDRYQKELTKLNGKLDNVRDELGDKGYDAYLYATGQPNRVVIVSALDNSPASKAGIQAGDTVLSYDNKRIYSWNDLRQATTQGQAGDIVPVDLTRNGTPITVYVPRGPLGVQLDNQSTAPK